MADPVRRWASIAKAAEEHYGIPAATLLGLIKIESGGIEGRTSSAGAGGLTQFMPGTAKGFGVNVAPGHARSQIYGAAKYLKQLGYGSNPELALKKYNAGPGNPGAAGAYGRNVLSAAHGYGGVAAGAQPSSGGGGGGGGGGGTTSPGGQTTTTTTGQPSLGTQQSQLPLIQALLDSQQSSGPPAANIEAPSFSAHPTLPEGFGTVSGGGGPAPKADIGALAAAVKTLGGDVPASQQVTQSQQQGVSGSAGGGGAAPGGGNVQTRGYPTGRTGRIIGTPHTGTHTLGNWQSDNAVDIGVPAGTAMVALEGGTVVKVRHHPQDGGRFAGDQITIQGADGNAFFYAHGVSGVKPGQKVHSGDVIGKTGSANGVAHLHFGVEKGDPRKIIQRR